MTLEIIYEDDDVLVINKPAGLIVHSDGRTEEPSVAEWVAERYPQMREVGEPWTSPQGIVVPRPGIVHRLDRTTSGIMVIAKTQDAHAFLKAQFQNRNTEKEYRAFVYGHPKEDGGIIKAEIVRIRSVPPRWGVKREGEGKKHREAVTEWRVLERGYSSVEIAPPSMLDAGHQALREGVSFVVLFPKTGRTHQLRVHLKHLGYPIICDPLYAIGKPCLLGFERPALHAYRLTIDVPQSGRQTFEAPLPSDFQRALTLLSR